MTAGGGPVSTPESMYTRAPARPLSSDEVRGAIPKQGRKQADISTLRAADLLNHSKSVKIF